MRKMMIIGIIILLINIFLFTGYAEEGDTPKYGKVSYMVGKAMVKRADKKKENLKIGSKVHPGDLIKSYGGSRLTVKLPTGVSLQIKDECIMSLDEFLVDKKGNKSKIQMYLGWLKIKVDKLKKRPNNFNLGTPTAVVGVRGTYFEANINTDITILKVYEGSIEVRDKEGISPAAIVKTGFSVEVKKGEGVSKPVPIKSSGGSSSEDTSAPVITVLRPAGTFEQVRESRYTLQFIITDENLDKVFINGRNIPGVVSGSPMFADISLTPGRNKITISAEDKNRNSARVDKEIEYLFLPPDPPKR